jgi:thiazolylpeptide-type bacteriocin precursor
MHFDDVAYVHAFEDEDEPMTKSMMGGASLDALSDDMNKLEDETFEIEELDEVGITATAAGYLSSSCNSPPCCSTCSTCSTALPG